MHAALLDETRDAFPFLVRDDYCTEEKLSGRRMLLVKRGGVVRCYLCNGAEYVAPLPVVDFARTLPCDATLDGVLVGTEFIGFDVLELFGADMTLTPFEIRRSTLATVSPFRLVEHATNGHDKTALFDRVLASDGAGVVFKKLDGIYPAGQRTYGFEFSFYYTETFAVTDLDVAESSIGLMRDGQTCGRVRFPFNEKWPKVGELWEVRFDRINVNGKLIRPQLLQRRDDLGSDARAAAWWW
jgi:hypothetical protein